MLHSVLSYIKYIFSAKSKYGIHSPFIFNFITKGLNSTLLSKSKLKLKEYRIDLSKDTRTIEVTDFGAGSKVFKTNKREVSQIAKYAGISSKKAVILQKTVKYFEPKTILEVGTSLGIGTAAMCSVGGMEQFISLEGCPATAAIAQEYFEKHFPTLRLDLQVGEFSDTLPKVLLNTKFDLIYFDGNHRKKPTIDYFELALQAAHNDSLFIFDDIHWSEEMEEAWSYIKAHKSVKVSIDLFHLGLVFFRKEQVKQNFVIRA